MPESWWSTTTTCAPESTTYVDEAMMTGEPVPVKKQIHDTVIGGTVNKQGSIRIQTTAVGANTTLAKMIQRGRNR